MALYMFVTHSITEFNVFKMFTTEFKIISTHANYFFSYFTSVNLIILHFFVLLSY